ncbi:MAG: type II secretion system F family protein [Methylococcaceae bacterium]
MPNYSIKAANKEGGIIEEYRIAVDEQSLIKDLQHEGLMPIQVKPAGFGISRWFKFSQSKQVLSPKDIILFTRELATLLEAGLPLDRSLTVLKELTGKETKLFGFVEEVLQKVKGGSTLSSALESQSEDFSRFYLNMLKAGEAGGSVEDVLNRMAEYLEKSKELRDTVSTAMIYPAILVVMALGSVFLLLTFVVPQFTEMFESAGKELPVPTQIVVGVAEWLQSYWWVLLVAFVLLGMYIRSVKASPVKKAVWDQRVLKLPFAGDIIRTMETANLSRTLGTLLGNGVPILRALSIVKETVNNFVLSQALDKAEKNLKQGKNMSGAMIESGQFPKMAMQMIKMGEETGRMEEMLLRVATTYDKELKVTIQRMLALLEPVLIVVLGLLIAGIIISILMAILSVNDLAF